MFLTSLQVVVDIVVGVRFFLLLLLPFTHFRIFTKGIALLFGFRIRGRVFGRRRGHGIVACESTWVALHRTLRTHAEGVYKGRTGSFCNSLTTGGWTNMQVADETGSR